MTNENYNKYLEAVDVVCGECYGNEETCKSCPVRKCCDDFRMEMEENGND